MGCKTKINPQVVKAGLEETLIKHPRFSSLQVKDQKGDQMRWVPTIVNLDDHVCVPDLDPNMESPDIFVEDYISDLTRTTIDMSKPLWELHLLNVRVSNSESVAILRIHHSIGDGVYLMSIVFSLTRKTSDPNALPSIPVKKKKVTTISKNSDRLLWLPFKSLGVTYRLMRNTLMDIFAFKCTSLFLEDTKTPLKGAPEMECTPRRFVWRTFSLDDIKLVKHAMNMTVNDVVLGVTAAGLSRYLNRRYGEKENDKGSTEERNNLPKSTRLRATLAVNIRSSVGIQAFSEITENYKADAKRGNWTGTVLLPFNIALRDDPLDYVREAKTIVDRKKLSLEAIYTYGGAALIVKFIGIKAASALLKKVFTHTTMSFSNMVGPLEEISFCGYAMTYLATSVYGHPHGITIHFISYINKITIVLAVDEKCVPDPHQLCNDIEESLKLIKNAVEAREA
ncbi:O-acyltransferase wsd1-like [Thalictrum thalictroides]|uniref:O-acyltransferase wsd1-like n=1 Tax=Thalictrum thalictroides TaxID=46969 RepID=A0A7J6WFZ7_THATH|nr:O-acyltransferase wsd1-like [Thalictrum thalictroides]